MSHYPTRSSKARKRPLIQSLVLEVVIIKEFESLMTGQKSKGPSVQPFHYHLYSSAGVLYPNLCFCTKLASGFELRNFMPWGSGTNLYTTILPKKSKLFFFYHFWVLIWLFTERPSPAWLELVSLTTDRWSGLLNSCPIHYFYFWTPQKAEP